MKQIVINSETPENKALEKAGDKSAAAAVNSKFNSFYSPSLVPFQVYLHLRWLDMYIMWNIALFNHACTQNVQFKSSAVNKTFESAYQLDEILLIF